MPFHSLLEVAENSDGKFGLNGKRPLSFFPLLPERPKFSVPFVWITCSAGSLLGEREILPVFCKLHKSIQFLFSVRKNAMLVYCLEHSIRRNSTTFSDVPFLPEIFQKERYIYFPMGLSGMFWKMVNSQCQYHLPENFHRNFRRDGKRSGRVPGARFSKVPVTFRGRNQIFKSKYKE